uniref:Uncharacterized protein n=1 Tax=Romanomermis culicivorax TaxID=13658 RepID=A0A915JZX3_ROMCU
MANDLSINVAKFALIFKKINFRLQFPDHGTDIPKEVLSKYDENAVSLHELPTWGTSSIEFEISASLTTNVFESVQITTSSLTSPRIYNLKN